MRLGFRLSLLTACLLGLTPALRAEDPAPLYPRQYSVNYDPYIESTAQSLHEYGGWNSPIWLNDQYMTEFTDASHGLMNLRHAAQLNFDDYPLQMDGFKYTDATFTAAVDLWHTTGSQSGFHAGSGVDYKLLSQDFDFERRVDLGQIDEVNNNCAPFMAYWETNMSGYGGYWCNSGATQRVACSRIYVIAGFNYERGVAEMLHSQAHRSESIMSETYGGWNTNRDLHLWDRYAWNYGQTTISTYFGVGSCHYPFNGDADYDYADTRTVMTVAPYWMTMDPNTTDDFPDLQGTPVALTSSAWGGPDYQLNFMKYFYSHMPHFTGNNNADGYYRLNNWWEYLFNFNEHTESGGDFQPGGVVPVATAYPMPVTHVDPDTSDDWRPQINAHGRMVWESSDPGDLWNDYEIFTANADGTNVVQITANRLKSDELPQINDNDQIVWQGFDGRDFEIYTANADGTNVHLITTNNVQDWHADINNNGRIVWQQFDGEDYEIMSCNFDGSDLVQITNNTNGGVGMPRNDAWPRINDSNRVVWMGYDGTNWQIFSANSDGTGLVQLTSGNVLNEYPQITNSGLVVWHGWVASNNAEIYTCSATGGTVTQLTSNSVPDWWPQANDAGQVVWMSRMTDWEIMTAPADGSSTPVNITNNSQHDQYPQIDNNGRIVWHGFDGNDWEIYAYADGVLYQITDNDYDDRGVNLGGNNWIAWHGESDGVTPGRTTDIFTASALADITPPDVTDVQSNPTDPYTVTVTFTEPVEAASAEVAGNYAILSGVTVTAAALQPDEQTVVLTTTEMTLYTTYTLVVNNVRDLAETPNTIPTDTSFDFYFGQWPRVSDGLQVLYDFEEGEGSTVYDVSGVNTYDLTINAPANVTWSTDGLTFDSSTFASSVSATNVGTASQTSSALTIEAWVQPATATASGPATIFTYSNSIWARNFTLGQGYTDGSAGDVYEVRLRTSTTDINGIPSVETAAGTVTTDMTQVVYTRSSDGAVTVYLNGEPILDTTVTGTFDAWNVSYRLVLGNELSGDRPWLGTFRLVALYERALTPAEVQQNYLAGGGAPPVGVPGDANCDGTVNFFDIDPFVAALTGEAAWQSFLAASGYAQDCPYLNNDTNGDGNVDFFDIDPFVALLTQ